jgi:hypothetical protein
VVSSNIAQIYRYGQLAPRRERPDPAGLRPGLRK